MSAHHWIDVAVQTPAHSPVGGLLTYRSPFLVLPGQLVRVPLGKRDVLAVVWALLSSLVLYGLIRHFVGLRLSQEDEFQGADLSIHKISASPDRESSW